MNILEWVVIGQVLIFVFALIFSCHVIGEDWLTKGGTLETLQDCSVESLIEEKK